MRTPRPAQPEETRADIARRRLALLVASFDATLPPVSEDRPERSRPERHRVEVPHVRVLATVSVAAAVLLVWWLLSGRPEASDPVAPLAFGQASAPSMSQSTAPSSGTSGATPSTSATEQLVIDVIGKVRKPGIVSVPKGSRVYQAIEAAGGLRGRVDTASLNMARVLSDGEQILVGLEPAEVPGLRSGAAAGAGAGGGNGAGPASGVGAKVNLNTATAEQLDTLPGVGPVTAKSILDWREKNGRFGAVDDLLDVKGIGDATLAELRDLVIV